ncbi:PREDICTED: heterogeneous nuclear ribonucleoprotein U-like isoform X2 [Atta colombica]|uniref:heterogeneous nuclear ribonucleoprotein U-like isoform X2 n=1 Tax=Atta colombica TaxID=520822 RepID=UPI00084CD6C7|nr:PREDICTED: heterogeneous nuclear ribonucleoprotein U-like isoform X2 [Atta colombica]XP_018045376.1 PREDICTED: heterogeneous nuclear ribonucleoprotein U-like isoform X2 [Atta colombica]XP_018045377.1 PREDICTED: heterogeneous nuclear ribonucleoprotein U-like isoform X2 [Atta colombica]
MMDPSKLKVVELRAALSERGLDTKGNKPVLVERLRKALEEEAQECGSDLQTENIDDTALKETQERVVEATRSSQSPRTPNRASRSSSVTTPTKISTRNASRASTTPNSSKQSTPNKSQYDEKAYETPMMNEETITQQQEMSKLSPEKYREEQEDDVSNILQNKIDSSDKYEEEAKHVNILEGNRANTFQVPVTEPSDKSSTIACVDQFSIIQEAHEVKGSSIDEVDKVQQLAEETKDITKLEEKIEIKDEDKISIEKEYVEHKEDGSNIKDNIDIPEVEQPIHMIPDQADKMACELKHEEKTIHDDYTVQDKKMDISANVENLDEKIDTINISQDKQQKATLDAGESNQMECNDRKRKRSPSPAEIRQLSPMPQKSEDEPDLDESTVILSWYDSDLNLIINKDGFLSGTPMHDGDLCDMWAGARASHGVSNGKVYYEARIVQHYPTITKDKKQSHMLRIGWSVPSTSMQLGEEKLSYAYTSAGKQGTDKKFTDYGSPFGKDDVVGCYLDMTPESTIELFYTVNGKNVGSAFSICKEELGDRPLFPHILSKNCTFVCNFGQEEAWCEQIPGYILVGNIESKDRIAGPRRPNGKADCEVIMMCGLPAAGKTTWARKHAADHPDKLYNILAVHKLVEKTGDVALSDKEQNICQREIIIDRCNRALDQLINVASGRRRNYILDQKSNIYSSVQRRKMRNFCGYQRKAIVVIPTDKEYNQRLSMHNTIEGNSLVSNLTEMKANFTAPSVGEFFDVVEWTGLGEEEAKKLVEKYNKEGKDAGFSQQPPTKQPRLDKTESIKETRDSRNNRDTRDRRNNYQDRGRNSSWRGSNMGGWRGERPQRGGYMRHTGGYGPPPVPWRLRGRGGSAMARSDRRMGGIDRRSGNDRNRSVAPRQGGWGSMSGNYQGSQQSSWGQQDNWSGSQATGNWNQQSGWGQQQWGGGWKGYSQGTYGQTGYNQHGYGNGNWNSWNQQYYNNQYWGQQQQSGQTTAASGQAVSKQ